MESLGVWFLGVIAVSTLVQAAFMVALALGGLRLARRVEELQARIDRELRPTLDHLSRITRNLAEVSDLATLQARRIDGVLAKVESGEGTAGRLVQDPELYNNMNGALKDLRQLVADVRRDPQKFLRVKVSLF